MRHGLAWDEWNISYLNSNNLNSRMNNDNDPIQFLLDRPMATTPGTTFAYSTGISYVIGRILQIATEQTVTEFMTENLFAPLGITKYDAWLLYGQIHTGSALYLTSRDMAKFGQLFLNEGEWNGNQVISKSWIEESTQSYVLNETWGYGYQWWTTDFLVDGVTYSSFYADGFGGQYIFVIPALDTVVVFNGRAYNEGEQEQYHPRSIIRTHIIPAIVN